jgi:hypothetical protein
MPISIEADDETEITYVTQEQGESTTPASESENVTTTTNMTQNTQTPTTKKSSPSGGSQTTVSSPTQSATANKTLVGVWEHWSDNKITVYQFLSDGTYYYIWQHDVHSVGSYKIVSNGVVEIIIDGKTITYPYEIKDNKLFWNDMTCIRGENPPVISIEKKVVGKWKLFGLPGIETGIPDIEFATDETFKGAGEFNYVYLKDYNRYQIKGNKIHFYSNSSDAVLIQEFGFVGDFLYLLIGNGPDSWKCVYDKF